MRLRTSAPYSIAVTYQALVPHHEGNPLVRKRHFRKKADLEISLIATIGEDFEKIVLHDRGALVSKITPQKPTPWEAKDHYWMNWHHLTTFFDSTGPIRALLDRWPGRTTTGFPEKETHE
jgi:hypothetical protein